MNEITLRKISKPGCRPCAILTNYLEDIAVDLLALDVEVVEECLGAEPAVIDRYGISSVPVMIVERNGVEMARMNGLVAGDEIIDVIKAAKEAK